MLDINSRMKCVFRDDLENSNLWSSYYFTYYNDRPVICFVQPTGDVWGLFGLGYTGLHYLDNFNSRSEFCITNTKHMDLPPSLTYSSLSEVLKELELLSIVELL